MKHRDSRKSINCPARLFVAIMGVVFLASLAAPARAQTFTVIHNFTGGSDGGNPNAGLTVDRAGNFYGTTYSGGTGDCDPVTSCGTVFKLARSGNAWILTPIYDFQGFTNGDGGEPQARVIFGPDGALYGTTSGGGMLCVNGCGTVFRLTPAASACKTALCPWRETVLYEFQGNNDGSEPSYGDVSFDRNGNLYGTTIVGGGGLCNDLTCGTVYELSPSGGSWTEQVIYRFENESLGYWPYGGVTPDNAGNLYGASTWNYSTAYELTPANGGWSATALHTFSDYPAGGTGVIGNLIFDNAGNLYGTTSTSGPGGGGTVFELARSGDGWNFNLLYSFSYSGSSENPGPWASLAMDTAGNLYGTTYADGANGCGSVFKLTSSGGTWTYSSLHDFACGSDGGNPISNVTLDLVGNLYGTASTGGGHGDGVAWEITP